MTPSKAFILSLGSIGNLNCEVSPGSLGELFMNVDGSGDGLLNPSDLPPKIVSISMKMALGLQMRLWRRGLLVCR
jgi:hypothetical protein